ncbi:SufD family Fe-S cluster assembly protein [Spiroplasma monobiae]|uniref:Fe-S cluster assembly protein SufD n=1 Tax=Spiroplasma monobiae MQ-1 TaxID=1336748 RepID=A0A2K9LYP1_SPISQ|nr:SufD family Fe-S cluster assembly protein [Spiroplasma monobiae]AUM62874.1 Fe-S cluster assembly protein SufD [Spiroplasma monobiae MQ-1]
MINIKLNESYIDFRDNLPSNFTFSESENKIILLENKFGSVDLNIEQDVEMKVVILFLPSKENSKKEFNITFNLMKNSKLDLKISNIANYNCDDNFTINLNEENTAVEFYNSTIINKDIKKNSVIKSVHNARNSYSNIKTYEVLKDTSKGFIRCISDIKKGSNQAEAHQELRLLVLDKEAKADSDPVLLIDENDIVASHANAIGMLDPDQVFYLLSRGLNKTQAQELIINGYFEPVFQEIGDEELLNHLKEKLKEMI